jgi:glutaredoxin-dependent peroxiredoxin
MYRLYIITLISFTLLSFSRGDDPLAIGSPAPDFKLPYATKEEIAWEGVRLSDIIGEKNIILAFYPANWSGGCSKQLCLYRDNFSALQDLDALILAISGDYVYAHHAWAQQEEFPFMLLSDHLHEVGKLYDSYNQERGLNKRTVFVIDRHGKIAYRNMKYSVADEKDFEMLKEVLAGLK